MGGGHSSWGPRRGGVSPGAGAGVCRGRVRQESLAGLAGAGGQDGGSGHGKEAGRGRAMRTVHAEVGPEPVSPALRMLSPRAPLPVAFRVLACAGSVCR